MIEARCPCCGDVVTTTDRSHWHMAEEALRLLNERLKETKHDR